MSFFRTIREGIQYMDAFPEDILLNPVFPEYRVKRCMKFARILLPPFIILILVWTYIRGGGLHGVEFMFVIKSNWPVTLCCVILLLMIPLQGYWWFGRRATLKLNARLKIFYIECCLQLHRSGKDEPCLLDLALVMRDAIKVSGRDILRKL